jgi:hypothetical protein
MCTITFSPRARGYLIAMNRDEKRVRAAALPPKVHHARDCLALFPSEAGGGTWIAANDAGVSFALVNWYAVKSRVFRSAVTRGLVVKTVAHCRTLEEALDAWEQLPLARMNPFRAVGFFANARRVCEWRWDLKRLRRLDFPWQPRQWISSGYDEPGAQRVRSGVWRAALKQRDAGSLAWCRRLHASHRPTRGPYSTCMHRDDAATVSYAEIRVGRREVLLGYQPGPPCQKQPKVICRAPLVVSGARNSFLPKLPS